MVVRRVISLLLFAAPLVAAAGEDPVAAGLRARLAEAHDTAKRSLYVALFEAYKNVQPDSAMAVSKRMLQFSEALHDLRGSAIALEQLGFLYSYKGEDGKALRYLFKAKELFTAAADRKGLAKTYNTIGQIPEKQGRHDKALNYYFRALRTYESVGDEVGKAHVYTNMGNVHKKQYSYQKALDYYGMAERVYRRYGLRDQVASIALNMGTAYSGMGDQDKALARYYEALRIYERIGHRRGVAFASNNIGVIYYLQGIYKDALAHFRTSHDMALELDQKDLIALTLCNIGETYIYLDDYISSMKYFDEGIELNKKLNNKNQLVYAYEGLTKLYERVGDLKNAIEIQKKYMALKESILDEERTRAMAEIQANYENDRKEKEIAYKNLLLEKRAGEQKLLLGIIVLSFLVLTGFIYGFVRNRKTTKELEKLSIVASKTQNGVLIFDPDGRLEYINEGFGKMWGYTKEELIRERGGTIQQISQHPSIEAVMDRARTTKMSITYNVVNKRRDGKEIWVSTTFSPIVNEKGELHKIVAIDTDITESKRKSEEIENSILYAKRIQEAILPMRGQIAGAFPESFIFYRPKAIVSGDFYWFAEKNGSLYIAAGDCTGHGVPGAFMSVLGSNALNQIIRSQEMKLPSRILGNLHETVRMALKQDVEGSEMREGMDIALCCIDRKKGIVNFAGAQRPLYLVRNGVFEEILPHKFPIGGLQPEVERVFSHTEFHVSRGDTLYLFTDGYPDQFGGPEGKKFMNKRFRELLEEVSGKPMDVQELLLRERFDAWKGREEQVDDVLVIGLRV